MGCGSVGRELTKHLWYLGFDPQHSYKLNMVVSVCSPNTQEVEAGDQEFTVILGHKFCDSSEPWLIETGQVFLPYDNLLTCIPCGWLVFSQGGGGASDHHTEIYTGWPILVLLETYSTLTTMLSGWLWMISGPMKLQSSWTLEQQASCKQLAPEVPLPAHLQALGYQRVDSLLASSATGCWG